MNKLIDLYACAEPKHAYEIEVNANGDYVKVYAKNRTQAASYAKLCGYEVRSVNMVG